MSIANHHREVALKALNLFQRDIESKSQGQSQSQKKPYLNAVQKALLLLGSQGLRRTVLYITAQMGKEDKGNEGSGSDAPLTNSKAWQYLYNHLAEFLDSEQDQFQHEVLCQDSKEAIARKEPQVAFFLLCLKRLAESAEYGSKTK